jgi:hypothetical protein
MCQTTFSVIFVPPDNTCATNASKNLAVRYLSCVQPVVECLLHPIRHGDGPDVPSFSDQVNDGPMVFPALNVIYGQIDELSPTESTT